MVPFSSLRSSRGVDVVDHGWQDIGNGRECAHAERAGPVIEVLRHLPGDLGAGVGCVRTVGVPGDQADVRFGCREEAADFVEVRSG